MDDNIGTLKRIVEMKGSEGSIYEKGWVAFYFLESKNNNLEFFKQLKLDIEMLINNKQLTELLFRLDDTIGFILSLYSLIKSNMMDKESDIVKVVYTFVDKLKQDFMEYDGELIFSLFILNNVLDLNLDFRKIFETSFEEAKQVDELRNKVYAFLAFTFHRKIEDGEKDFVHELFKELTLTKNLNIIKRDIELSSHLITALSCLVETRKILHEDEIDFAKKIIDELFLSTYKEIEKLIGNLDFVRNIIDIISFAKENIVPSIDETLRQIIEFKNNTLKIHIDNFPATNIKLDLLAKFLLCSIESGFDKPFLLSRKEYDTYIQIKNEIKKYRRIRKYELILLFLTIIAFINIIIANLPILSIPYPKWDLLLHVILLDSFIVSLFTIIYRKGEINLQDFIKLLKEKILDKISIR